MQPEEIIQLQDAIRATHGCESRYERTEHVHEVFQGKMAWDSAQSAVKVAIASETRH
jgi:hypothetical protein